MPSFMVESAGTAKKNSSRIFYVHRLVGHAAPAQELVDLQRPDSGRAGRGSPSRRGPYGRHTRVRSASSQFVLLCYDRQKIQTPTARPCHHLASVSRAFCSVYKTQEFLAQVSGSNLCLTSMKMTGCLGVASKVTSDRILLRYTREGDQSDEGAMKPGTFAVAGSSRSH